MVSGVENVVMCCHSMLAPVSLLEIRLPGEKKSEEEFESYRDVSTCTDYLDIKLSSTHRPQRRTCKYVLVCTRMYVYEYVCTYVHMYDKSLAGLGKDLIS